MCNICIDIAVEKEGEEVTAEAKKESVRRVGAASIFRKFVLASMPRKLEGVMSYFNISLAPSFQVQAWRAWRAGEALFTHIKTRGANLFKKER